jgi:Fe-S-cluster-containing hydrogenase component 2
MAEEEFELVDKVTFERETCVGCRSCELACSFYHVKYFQRGISSIVITNVPNSLSHYLTIYRQSANNHIACDMCKGLEVPLCVQFCPATFRDELEKLLKAHLSAPKDDTSQG